MENLSTSPSGISSATTVSNASIHTDVKSTVSLDTKEQASKSPLSDKNFAYKPYDVITQDGSKKKKDVMYESVELKPKKYLDNQTLESVVVAEVQPFFVITAL